MDESAAYLSAVRSSPEYPRAIWLARAGNLVGIPLVVWALTSEAGIGPVQPRWVFFVGWAIMAPLLGGTLLLFFRAGLRPLANSNLPTVRRQVYFDVFRPRRYWGR